MPDQPLRKSDLCREINRNDIAVDLHIGLESAAALRDARIGKGYVNAAFPSNRLGGGVVQRRFIAYIKGQYQRLAAIGGDFGQPRRVPA